MKPSIRQACLLAAALSACAATIRADEPRVERLVLENGLEVIVAADGSSSLAYAELSIRPGAEGLAAAEAGSLDLLGRLAAREAAPAWTYRAEAERLAFSASMKGDELGARIGPLAAALSSPAIDEAALEEERESALAALAGAASDPDAIYEAALTGRLFAKYPWRRAPAGSEKSIRAATAESLRRVAASRLRPSEATLVLTGAIDAGALAEALSSLAAWTAAGPAPAKAAPSPHPKPGVARPTWLAYPDPSMAAGSFSVELRYRGPDSARAPASCAAGELWAELASNPEGRFMKALAKEAGGSAEGVQVECAAAREGGIISISAGFAADGKRGAAERARDFKETARGTELTAMRSSAAYCSAAEYDAARARIAARRDQIAGDAVALARELADWRSRSTLEAYLSFPDSLAALGPKEIMAFVDAYILKNLELIAIRMNPADYERERASLAASGFEAVSAAKAFWK